MRILDKAEKRILELLQEDSTMPLAAIAAAVSLSPTPCWRRIQRLKDEGIVRKEVALVDAEKINVGVTVFVSIRIGQHNATWLKKFVLAALMLPQVVELYRMSGEVDLLLRIVVPDIKGYDQIYKRLMAVAREHGNAAAQFDVSSSFALEQIKYTTSFPLDYA